MGRRLGELRIGTSGWQYPHWRGAFYPRGLPVRRWLEHYAEQFDCVEVNATFYRLPTPEVFDAWRRRAPEGFLYALKLSRFVTHRKRLKDPRPGVRAFVRAARRLRDHLGPVLVQLPPHWHADLARLDGFLAAIPRGLRFALEFRDPSWLVEPVFERLRARGAALCLHDAVERHPVVCTADWTYLRFHGPAGDAAHGYAPQRLSAWARRIRRWRAEGMDVHAYFNNDLGGHAVRDALALRRMLASGPRTTAGRTGPRRAGGRR